MEAIQKISFIQWLQLVEAAKLEGMKGSAFLQLKKSYPDIEMPKYTSIVFNALASLEVCFLQNTIEQFQRRVNIGFEEADIEVIRKEINQFKQNIENCFFFCRIQPLPQEVKSRLVEYLMKNIIEFVKDWEDFIKKTMEFDNNSFYEELEYIYQKAKIKGFVEGFEIYG